MAQKDTTVHLRFSRQEYDLLLAVATLNGTSKSRFIRDAAIKAALAEVDAEGWKQFWEARELDMDTLFTTDEAIFKVLSK